MKTKRTVSLFFASTLTFFMLLNLVMHSTYAQGAWYWKPSFGDYAPSGMPDFDQKQGGTYLWQDQWQAWSHCGPVACANSLWWLDSEFEPDPTHPPPTIHDGFPLVRAYGQWDDHDPLNVPPLVEHLAFLMDTDGRRTHVVHSGTSANDMQAGLIHYLSWTGVNPLGDVNGDGVVDPTDANIVNLALGSHPGMPNWNLAADIFPASISYPPFADNVVDQNDMNLVLMNMGAHGLFYEHTANAPDFNFIVNEVERCQDVVLLIGYWYFTGTQWYREQGAHFVTVAGADFNDIKLAISDPVNDAFESGLIPEGRIPIPHVHLPPEPPYITHNNAAYVSQDIYNVIQISPPLPPCPGGNWAFINFAGLPPGWFAVFESAIVTSPYVRDIAVTNVTTSKQGCLPEPIIGRGQTAKINVTVENQGEFTETFTVTALAGSTVVGTQTVSSLAAGAQTIVTINWNTTGFAYGSYTISANVTALFGEADIADNVFVDGGLRVGVPGDIDASGKVDMRDIGRCCSAFGATPGTPKWDPNSDLDCSEKIDMRDIGQACSNFGQHE